MTTGGIISRSNPVRRSSPASTFKYHYEQTPAIGHNPFKKNERRPRPSSGHFVLRVQEHKIRITLFRALSILKENKKSEQ